MRFVGVTLKRSLTEFLHSLTEFIFRAGPPLDGCGVRLTWFESVKNLGSPTPRTLCRIFWPCQLLCQGIRAALAGLRPCLAAYFTQGLLANVKYQHAAEFPARGHTPFVLPLGADPSQRYCAFNLGRRAKRFLTAKCFS